MLLGILLVCTAGLLTLLGNVADIAWAAYGPHIGILGYIILLAGGSGYLAFWIFERRPEP